MKDTTKRYLLFLVGCVGARLFLTMLACRLKNDPRKLKQLALVTGAIGVGFLYQHFTGRKTGPEVFGGKIWWDSLRPIHALLYISFSVMVWSEKPVLRKNAYFLLLVDLVLGVSAFACYHASRK